MAETSYATTKRTRAFALRSRFRYRQFREIVLTFAFHDVKKLRPYRRTAVSIEHLFGGSGCFMPELKCSGIRSRSGGMFRYGDDLSRSRGLSTRGRGTFAEVKPPVFVLADRGSGERYVVLTKTATESWIRLLLVDRQQESVPVYTDGFRAHEPLKGTTHSLVNVCESHASLARRWVSPHRGVSKNRLIPISERFNSATTCSEDRAKKRSKRFSKLRYDSPTISATRAMTD